MLTSRVVKTGNSIDKAIRHLQQANNKVEIGVFGEQGQHPTANMTYVELLRYHASPDDPNTPTRDVIFTLSQALHTSKLKHPEIQKAIMRWASQPFSKQSDKKLLNDIGKVIRDWGKDYIFGNPNVLADNSPATIAMKDGRNEPLVDDGHLRNAFAFKTSLEKVIRENS